jgi:putative acetyltransferase
MKSGSKQMQLAESRTVERNLSPRDIVCVERVSGQSPADALDLIEEYYQAGSVLMRDDREALLRYIAGPHSAVWVATCNGLAAGCILLRKLPQFASAGELKRLYVRPAFRQCGIAARLLQAAEGFARKQNISTLYLDTNEDFREAVTFYQRHGYARCERYNNNPQATIFLCKDLAPALVIRTFEPGDEKAFRELNEAWIAKHFRIEEKDQVALCDPRTYILNTGGQIFMALRDNTPVGCCALLAKEEGVFEVAKMTVAESERGHGLGRGLLEHVIAHARAHGIKRLYLETNSALKNAIHLYESVGFRHLPPERIEKSPYARADVYMEMVLHG